MPTGTSHKPAAATTCPANGATIDFEVKRMNQVKKFLKEWVPSLAIAIIIAFLLNTYVAEAVKVPSGSMLPTIQLGDRFIVEKLVHWTDFHFGDIVVFYPPLPDQKDERFIKRLIGLPGDTIQIKDGALYRNGKKVDEPYIEQPMNYSYGPITVPPGKYFFLGDNRNESLDSHLWPTTPFVDRSKIVGKVILRIFPFSSIKVY